MAKANQFLRGTGQLNFNYVGIVVAVIPSLINFVIYCAQTPKYYPADMEGATRDRYLFISLMFGWAGTVALAFFLIPVTRHSVLLAALGWSPIHALRIHVVTGWFAWWNIALHGLLFVVDWFVFNDSVVDAIWPPAQCWQWRNPSEAFDDDDEYVWWENCGYQFFNFTGIFAGLFFLILAATSINWFRRRNYRLFYILHVTFGTATLIASCFHWPGITTVIMPSLVYYLASTSPTLIQALASYRRGGHKIVKLLHLGPNAGHCVEVHVQVDTMTDAVLSREPCSYVKLCVPGISVVWHPFTVFKHPSDSLSVRFLFRPVGPFTKKLATALEATPRPVTILDGLYSVGNYAVDALHHDYVLVVAGGVAVTPFLSLIPNLLGRLQEAHQAGNAPKTRTIVLHWVCREVGLIEYILHNYLQPVIVQAQKVKDVAFEIHVHRTGSKEEDKSLVAACDDTEELQDASENTEELQDIPENVSSSESSGTSVNNDVMSAQNKGFAMELARMMPGRYGQVWRNVPLFLALTFLIWIGQWIYFHFDVIKNEQQLYNIVEGAWISSVTWIFVSIAISIVIEGVVLNFRSHWPAPEPEQYYISCARDEEDRIDKVSVVKPGSTNDMMYHEHTGRPDPSMLLDEARRQATAPGLFLCGPVAMTEALKKEARNEDSWCLTRFVVYEELFEM